MTNEPTEPTKPNRRGIDCYQFEGNNQVVDVLSVGQCELRFIRGGSETEPIYEVRARFPDGRELILSAFGRP